MKVGRSVNQSVGPQAKIQPCISCKGLYYTNVGQLFIWEQIKIVRQKWSFAAPPTRKKPACLETSSKFTTFLTSQVRIPQVGHGILTLMGRSRDCSCWWAKSRTAGGQGPTQPPYPTFPPEGYAAFLTQGGQCSRWNKNKGDLRSPKVQPGTSPVQERPLGDRRIPGFRVTSTTTTIPRQRWTTPTTKTT